MLDRLVELFSSIWTALLPFTIVYDWQCAVLIRFGRYKKDAAPGIVFHWPLGFEQVVADFRASTTNLPPQPLTTRDGVSAGVSAVVTWRVRNARKFLLEVEGREGAMADATLGAVARAVAGADWSDVCRPEFTDSVRSEVQRRANRYGIEVLDLAFSGCQRGRSLHLWGSLGKTPAEA